MTALEIIGIIVGIIILIIILCIIFKWNIGEAIVMILEGLGDMLSEIDFDD